MVFLQNSKFWGLPLTLFYGISVLMCVFKKDIIISSCEKDCMENEEIKMKKKIAMMLLTTMVLSMTACGNNDADVSASVEQSVSSEASTSTESTPESSSAEAETQESSEAAGGGEENAAGGALEVIESVWATYEEENKFAAGGGDSANMNFEGPGAFDATNAEELDITLGFPAAQVDKIDDAASLMHMMNANTFTGGVYHVTDAANVQTVADALKENIMNRQWMCGFPETLIIVSVGDNYLVSAFGNGEIIETFKTKLSGVYADATVLYEESL